MNNINIMMQQHNNSITTDNQTTQSVFSISIQKKIDLCLYNKNSDKLIKNISTVSNYEFSKRLIDKLGKYIDENFDWSNVLIAGGLISGLIDSDYDVKKYEQSDIDIFVYGLDNKKVMRIIQYIYEYFSIKLKNNFYSFAYIPHSSIISIVIPGECTLQIIGTLFETKMDVLRSFDMTHCQVGYDDKGIIYTSEFIDAITSRTTVITTKSVNAYRLVKAYHRGYSIADPEYCYIKNIFHKYTNEHRPKNTDKFYDIHKLQYIIEELENNVIVQQNLTKNYIPPKHLEYTKEILDEEMKKIGELHAGKDQYIFINDCINSVYVENITELIKFQPIMSFRA